jgi:hypothetical protein
MTMRLICGFSPHQVGLASSTISAPGSTLVTR